MSTPGQMDFSRQAIPGEWTEAAAEAPSGGDKPYARPTRLSTPPERDTVDLFIASLAAMATTIVSSVGWYQLQVNGVTTPWVAVGVGLALAVAVRLGGGPHDSQSRGILTLLFYLATTAVVLYLATRWSYRVSYGTSPDWGQFEDELLSSRLTEPLSLVALFSGATVAVWASKLFR